MADRGDALAHDHDRSIGDARRQRRPEACLCGEVERREGVVEDIDVGLYDERPGDRQALALPARDVRAALVDLAVEPVGHRLHEAGGLGDVERVPELGVGGFGPAEAQVRRHRAGEEVGPLRHVADPAPQQLGCQIAHVDAVDEHRPGGGVEQARDQVDDRRLAGAGAADDRCRLARCDSERHIGEYRMSRARIGERDVTELDRAALGRRRHGRFRRSHRGLGVEHLDDPFRGDGGAGDHRHHECQHHDRHQDLDQVRQVSDQRSDLEFAAVDATGADPQHRNAREVDDQSHGREHQRHQTSRPQ